MRGTPIVVELKAAATIDAAETIIGAEFDVKNWDYFILWLDYTKGDETGVFVYPKFLHTPAGDEHQWMSFTAAADATVVEHRLSLTATGKVYAVFDVRGIHQVRIFNDADGGTPTGTLQTSYTLYRVT